jgi:hypothetical protein
MANISEENDEVEEEKNSKMKRVPKRRVMLLLPGQKKALADNVVALVRQLSENQQCGDVDETEQKVPLEVVELQAFSPVKSHL